MYTATSNTRQEVLGDLTKVQGEFCWHEGGGSFIKKMVFDWSLEGQQKEKWYRVVFLGCSQGLEAHLHVNDGRNLGLGMPRSSGNGGVYRECHGGWGMWEMRREASAERQGR